MLPLTDREDLTALVARHAPSNACATAMKENRAVVLGGFIPAGCLPCWIVQVTGKHRQTWIIAVECDEANVRFTVKFLDRVPWEWWIGRSNGKRPLIDGDRPRVGSFYRMKARHELAKNRRSP